MLGTACFLLIGHFFSLLTPSVEVVEGGAKIPDGGISVRYLILVFIKSLSSSVNVVEGVASVPQGS